MIVNWAIFNFWLHLNKDGKLHRGHSPFLFPPLLFPSPSLSLFFPHFCFLFSFFLFLPLPLFLPLSLHLLLLFLLSLPLSSLASPWLAKSTPGSSPRSVTQLEKSCVERNLLTAGCSVCDFSPNELTPLPHLSAISDSKCLSIWNMKSKLITSILYKSRITLISLNWHNKDIIYSVGAKLDL